MGPYDNNDIYDDQEGLGKRSSGAPDFEPPQTYPAAPDIHNSEVNAGSEGSQGDDVNSATRKEQDALADDWGEGYYKPGGNQQRQKDLLNNIVDRKGGGKATKGRIQSLWGGLSNKRKAKIAGVLVGVIGGGTFMGIAIPGLESLQLLHYSQTLQSIMKPHTVQNESKISKFYRSMTDPNNPGRTRLSFLQNVNHTKLMAALEDQGFKITSDSRFGRMGVVSMDIEKTKYNGMSPEEAKAAVAEDYGIPKGRITTSGFGSQLNVSFKNLPSATQSSILESMVRSSGKGKIASFFMLRHLRAYYNVPDLFHPLRKPAGAVQDWINLKADTLTKKLNEKYQKKLTAAQEKMNAFREKYSGAMTGIGATLMVSGIACMVVGASEGIHELNKETFTDVGAQTGAEAAAYGDQVSDPNSDVPYQIVDATNSNFYDSSGYSVFDSNSIRSLSGMNSIGNGDSYKTNYQNSYNILEQGFAYENQISVAARGILAVPGAKLACSPEGQAAQLVIGGALLVASASTPGGFLIEVAKTAAITYAVGVGMNQFIQMMSVKMPEMITHQGPLGGDLDAMGLQTGANAVAAAAGGTVTSAKTTSSIMKQVAEAERETAKTQSTYDKVLNPKNNTSFISKVIDGINPSPGSQARNIASSFLNIGTGLIKLPSTIFSARAHAATPTYTVGNIPLIAYSDEVMSIEDPVANGDEVASIMSSPTNSLLYTSKALVCHGTKLGETTDASGVTYYDAQNVQMVDPGSDEYQSAGCNDTSDKNWVKIQSFIGDVQVAESLSCTIANYDDSCNRMGMGSSLSSSSTTIDTSKLYTDTSAMACDPSDTRLVDLGVQSVEHDGKAFNIRLCGIKNISSNGQESTAGNKYFIKGADGIAIANVLVAKAFANLADDAAKQNIKLSASSTFRLKQHQQDLWDANPDSEAVGRPGESNHEVGIAMDFDTGGEKKSGASCSNRATSSSAMWQYLNGTTDAPGAQKFGIYQYAVEPWHWDASPTRCTTPS